MSDKRDITIGVVIIVIGYMLTRGSPAMLGGIRRRWNNFGGNPGPVIYPYVPDTRDYSNLKVGPKQDGTPYIIGGL